MTDAAELPEPTPEMVERALSREHTYRATQKVWAKIEASLRSVKQRYEEIPE